MQIPGFSKSLKSRAKLTYVMEELAKTRIKASLLLFLIHFVSSSFSYDVPKKYFINCGSDRTVNQTNRSFNGDEERSSSVFFTKQNTSVASSDRSAEDIYGTARIFRQQSSYDFETSDPNPSSMYIVRLHFLAFRSSDYNLSSAIFDVSTSSGILLLHGFSRNESAKQPLVKEFFVTVKSARFRIYLTPRGSSIAFLNAVEFFPAPPLEFGDDKVNGQKMFQSPPVLQTIYRINVGGDEIDDDLWRNWNSDDAYLQNKDSSTNTSFSGQLHYSSEDARFAAPDSVYETARRMKNSVSLNSSSKINWGFNVNKSSRHVVRAHFCDIISTNKETLYFNFYIKDNLELPNYTIPELAQPKYFDFNVDKESSGVLRISIGPSTVNEGQDAILNGLEILEIKEDSALVPIERDSDTAAKSKAKSVVVVAGSVIGGLAVLVFLVAVFFVAAKRRKRKKSREEGSAEKSSWGQVAAVFGGGNSNSRVTEQTISGSAVSNLHLGLRISLSEIHSATRRFSPKLVIGKGGFGSVYKGTLRCGTRVAVKRSSGRESGQGIDEFQTEITVLSSIRHRHLVSLIGYCDERDEMILVYEFMENGTLREHLYGNSSSPKPCLSWKQRLEICIGSASGLNYLHKGSSGRIIHRDVKSTNILLDENMVAKVADFGLSKAGPPEEAETTHVSTVVKGTMGYLDPEYCQTNQLTEKSDVYSFGVVLLEVLCARAPINPTLPRDQINLAWWVMKCKSEGALIEAVDPAIRGEISANSLRKFGETAEKCLHAEGPERPAMSDVIWELEYALQLQRTPAPREPHEDSTAATASGFSAALVLPDPAQIPDFEDHSGTDTADFSDMSASEVFSQLRRDAAR